jgi:hypothetical protein
VNDFDLNKINFPKVAIIILNWNGWKDTVECLESVFRIDYPNYQVIIVDNGSTDDSVQQIKENLPDTILIETGKNLGYTGGNNVGIKYAMENKAEYVLIVNNDTELVNSYFLQGMIDKMEEESWIGIMGPKVLNPGGQVQNTILFAPTLVSCIKESIGLRLGTKKSNDYNISQQVEAVSGVCWLIRRKVIEDIGLLDEDYFMYAEEQDYCYRAQKAGWKIMYYPVESILHYKEPVDKNEERNYRQYVYARRNLVLFLHKHFGFFQAVTLAILFFISNIFKVVISKVIQKGKDFYNVSLLFALFKEFKYALKCPQKYA